MKEADPDIAKGSVTFIGISLTPDSAALLHLDSMQLLPDDVYSLSAKAFYVSGLGIKDFLSSGQLDLQSVIAKDPVIDIFHKERTYNADKRLQKDTLTLYEKLTKQLKHFSLQKLEVSNANIISHQMAKKQKTTRYNHVSIVMKEILIDSTTQYDSSRFLFAKNADISLQNFSLKTADSLYMLKCASLHIAAAARQLTATGVELMPRFDKTQFQQKLKYRQDRYVISIPKIVLSGADWWKLANEEGLAASQASLYNCSFSDFIDRSLPLRPIKMDNYPHQQIMRMTLPLNIGHVYLKNMQLKYEEFNPLSGKSGILHFGNIEADIANVTNVPAQIRKNKFMTFSAKTMFMNQSPANITFKFNLAKVKTGDFSADIHVGAMDYQLINPFSEPLGLLSMKSGKIQEATGHFEGDNLKAKADFVMLYNDLYIIPLKKAADEGGDLKKKNVLGVLANLLFIKNENPDKKGNVRKLHYEVARQEHPNFFNQLWKTLLMGIIKSIGAPEKLAK